MDPILKLRRRLCLEIAEQFAEQFDLARTSYDADRAARLIDSLLPATRDESLAEAAALDAVLHEAAVPKNTGPSPLDRLREALGLGKEISIRETLRAAAERAERVEELTSRLQKIAAWTASRSLAKTPEWYCRMLLRIHRMAAGAGGRG